MRTVESALRRHRSDDRPFIEVLGGAHAPGYALSYRTVAHCAEVLATEIAAAVRTSPGSPDRPRVGVVMANTPAFVVADLALVLARCTEIPVPLAFSAAQAQSLLAEVDLCLVDEGGRARIEQWGSGVVLPPSCGVVGVDLERLKARSAQPGPPSAGEDWIAKIIHTSGTTSHPKGALIRASGLDALIGSLSAEMPDGAYARYLSMVPFSLLIEQVTGIYLVLADGGSVVLLPPEADLVGTASGAAATVLPYLTGITALVATPAVVEHLLDTAEEAVRSGANPVRAIFGTSAAAPLVCCGGAPVPVESLRRLDALGIPVHEGYGLSENSSVVCWNTPGQRRLGTVGRPLRHVEVALDTDNELLVRGPSLFAGYVREDPSACAIDDDGWLHAGKAGEAAANLAEAGLAEYARVAPGDARSTLAEVGPEVDVLVLDGWKDLYREVLAVVEPALRDGAVVVADNLTMLPEGYLGYVRDPARGYVSVSIPLGADGVELSTRARAGA